MRLFKLMGYVQLADGATDLRVIKVFEAKSMLSAFKQYAETCYDPKLIDFRAVTLHTLPYIAVFNKEYDDVYDLLIEIVE
jgi:hypothetical protein